MLHGRWRYTKLIILLVNKCLNNFSGKLHSCQTYTDYSKHYSKTTYNLLKVSFFRSRTAEFIFNSHLYSYHLGDLNVLLLNVFLDVLLLLSNTLLNGKSFKIIAIFPHANDNELKDLANIMSPYSVPIIPIMPATKSYIRSILRDEL